MTSRLLKQGLSCRLCIIVDVLSEDYRYKRGLSHHFAQALCVGFRNFSAVDIPVIVKLLFSISSFVWNTYSYSSLSYLSNGGCISGLSINIGSRLLEVLWSTV